MYTVLVVEDDSTLLSVLKYNLTKEGYQVPTASDGAQGLEIARIVKPDCIILDVMLPKMSGFEVCRILRKETTIPILMLTAREEETDKIAGLDFGADDYMTKPFSMRELLARVRAMLRRAEMASKLASTPTIKVGYLELDEARHVITKSGTELTLNPKEYDLLAFLIRNKELVFSREQLLEKVWGYDYDPAKPRLLTTIRGAGYKLEGKLGS